MKDPLTHHKGRSNPSHCSPSLTQQKPCKSSAPKRFQTVDYGCLSSRDISHGWHLLTKICPPYLSILLTLEFPQFGRRREGSVKSHKDISWVPSQQMKNVFRKITKKEFWIYLNPKAKCSGKYTSVKCRQPWEFNNRIPQFCPCPRWLFNTLYTKTSSNYEPECG